MARSENQKKKLITIRDILLKKTDEDHALTADSICAELLKYDISAERKSIYSDIRALEDIGLDVLKTSGREGGYYVASREFELSELKILVDVVQSAKFLTEKKSNALIDKLISQASEYQAKSLKRDVFIANRPKTDNENILINVDSIYKAMADNKKISFKYYAYNTNKELVARHEGSDYVISPWQLVWDDENYYLIGYDDKAEKVKYYRIDKMKKLSESSESRVGQDSLKTFDLAAFSKATFGMFDGAEKTVTLRCKDSMIGIMIDRFGKDIMVHPSNEEGYIEVVVKVNVSSQFFGWLCGLGKNVSIVKPADVAESYKAHLEEILKS